jgi:mRNA-degrading endonuclease YafQ of YafQ-DinJ toxin-antitoxin module
MVSISTEAYSDLQNILNGLLSWKKITLSEEFCHCYFDDIVDVCYSLDNKSVHFNAQYEDHKKFGSKVLSYNRNSQTTWYIIYNLNEDGNIFINKILSNYITKK